MTQNYETMEEIMVEIMESCALKYAKGFPRWMNLWEDQLSLKQKAFDIAQALEDAGYLLVKAEDLRPLVDDMGE